MGELSLIFRAGTNLCALPLEHVQEVMRPLPVEPMAGSPSFVAGLCVIRGRAVPVVHAAALVDGVEPTPQPRRPPARFVTVKGDGYPVALAVDSVVGIRPIPPASMHRLPPLLGATGSALVEALAVVDAELLLLLRAARILPDEVRRDLDTALAPEAAHP